MAETSGLRKTGAPALLREINQSLVIDLLRHGGPISRAGLSRSLGLAKPTVSALVNDLAGRGFIIEQGPGGQATAGRPSTLLQLNPRAGSCISADLLGDRITVLAADFCGQTVYRDEASLAEGLEREQILDILVEMMLAARRRGQSAAGRPLGAALAVEGQLNPRTGMLLQVNPPGWQSFPLKSYLGRHLSGPVFTASRTCLAALGEYFSGAAQGCDHVLYLTVGRGLEGAILQRGSFFGGSAADPARFGHIILEPGGEVCSCGQRGCWETLVSDAALLRCAAREAAAHPPGLLAHSCTQPPGGLTLPRFLEAAQTGDPAALTALEELGRQVGRGLGLLAHVVSPEIIVLGDTLSLAAPLILPAVNRSMQEIVPGRNEGGCQIAASRHGPDAALQGGIALVARSALPPTEPVTWAPW